jgi:FG-GAP repeat/Secretion system C-terminal sorting domain
MRRIFTSYPHSTTVFFLLFFSVPLLGQQSTLPRGVSTGWYHRAVTAIEDREYGIRPMDAPGVYAAVNHDQHLGYWFSAKGYGVGNFNEDGSTKGLWSEQFFFAGIGRGLSLRQAGAASVSRSGEHRLDFDYGGYTVAYDHEKPGMEQSFVIRHRLSGSKPLCIALQLSGDLAATVSGDALRLTAAGDPQDTRLAYDQLTVWDSHHRQLPAHMRLDASRRLLLTVDDSRAEYPLTVDPFAHAASITYTVQNILNSGIADATVHTLFGYSVAGSDVNKDGFSDIVIGAPTFANISAIASGGTITLSATITGAAFVFYGGTNGPSTTPSKVLQPSGLSVGALFGFSVSAIGTAGGTGSGIMVGAPGQQQTITYVGSPQAIPTGAVYVYYGSSTAFNNTITTIPAANLTLTLAATDFTSTVAPPTRNPLFGWSIADAGDINGDGFDEIIVGSPNYAESPLALGTSASGRIDIFNGSATGVAATHTTTSYGTLTGELFGFSVNTAGHVDGDATHAGIIVGAPGYVLTGSLVRGHAYVFYGASGGITTVSDASVSGTAGVTFTDPTTLQATLFGFSVSTAGDVDNDGHDDLIVGAPLTPNGATFGSEAAVGKAYIYYGGTLSGGALVSSRSSVTLTSPRAGSALNFLFGWSVANVANVTGDASADVVIGEPGSLPVSNSAIGIYLTSLGIASGLTANSGQAYVFAGKVGAAISATPILTISDPSTPNVLGFSVRGVGDVDGDGFPDLLIGEPGGSLDLSFSISGLAGQLSGSSSTSGTLTIGSGLLASNSIGNALLYFGFQGTLPLTMTSFTGEAQGNQTLLSWTTAEEQNTNYFQVQRSLDGQNFTAIGKVAAAGNSDVQTNYSFIDPSPGSGANYYRLNMVDLDGQTTYSNIVLINFNATASQAISAYPNPAHGSFQLLFQNMTPGRYGMNLLNSSGQTVLLKFIQVGNATSYNEMVNLGANLTPGTYFVRIVDSQNKSYITRIVIE